MLKGKKTYLAGIVGVLTTVGMVLMGDIEMAAGINQGLVYITLIFARMGIGGK